ncbi:MAG: sensor histidine kinase [Candidatus Adiutrix sp.]
MSIKISNKVGSLKADIAIATVVLILVISGLTGLIFIHAYGQALRVSRLEMAISFARATAFSLAQQDDWQRFNWGGLGATAKLSGLELVLVADRSGAIIHRDLKATVAAETSLRTSLSEGVVIQRVSPSVFGFGLESDFSISAPIIRNNLVSGALSFTGNFQQIAPLKTKGAVWLLSFTLINGVGLTFFVIFFLNRSLLRPLKMLESEFKSLGQDTLNLKKRPKAFQEVVALFESFEGAALELIDSRKQVKKQFEVIIEAQKKLTASEKMATVGRLASGIAHELGNPIGALMGFVRLLADDDLDKATKAAILEQSRCELSRMDKSIKELLRFSRPTSPELHPIDIAQVANSALGLTKPQIWAQGVQFELITQDDLPQAQGEHNLLLQVFLNLLANACQAFNPNDSHKKISININSDEGGPIITTISDNGPGINCDDAKHIFEPYFTKKTHGEGTGLGLAISMSIVNSLGGQLNYEPAEGCGAKFTVSVPCAKKI